MMTKRIALVLFLLIAGYSLLVTDIYAKEVTILYTGETHAMLYPCHCPIETDGGIARRLTLIRQLKKSNPATLVLDSGGFFSGGISDEYAQNTQLDMQRTSIVLKAMDLMRYDAVAVGDDEFNFGKEFLQEAAGKSKIAFLSSNAKADNIAPYAIKEAGGIKFGIIGVTPYFVKQKVTALDITEPKAAVKQALGELKKKGAQFIVLLSHIGESEDLKLIDGISGIDILITGGGPTKEEKSFAKAGAIIILRPAWQGRRLGKISLTIKDNKIADYKVEELRLSDKISDSPEIAAILPKCFQDTDCRKEGAVGNCLEPATLKARCVFSQSNKVNLSIITPAQCIACDTKNTTRQLKALFPGLIASYLYYPGAKADKLIKELGINALPVYLLGKEIEKEKAFENLKDKLELKGDFYLLKPQFSGPAYFLERKKTKGAIDLFISLYEKDAAQLLEAIKDFHPTVHFLAVQQQDKFDAAAGYAEAEEYLRSVCVQKYYPEQFWNYLSCRVKSLNSSWWEDCLGKFNSEQVKACARSEEGKKLLEENIRLNKELQVMFGPVYLLDNQELFGTQGTPTKENFKKIFKR